MNKKGEESTQYFGGKTINVILGVIVALFIAFVIGRFAYSYVAQETELQKAGKQLQNIVEEIEYALDEEEGQIDNFFPPKGWYLRSSDGIKEGAERDDENRPIKYGRILDEKCLMESCLCICKTISCNSDRICEGFDFIVEVDEEHGYESYYHQNTLRLEGFEKLVIAFGGGGNNEVDRVIIRRGG